MENTNNPTICYNCIYRDTVPGDAHSSCKNYYATVTANDHGIRNGWFIHPFNFDPIWLLSCTGYNDQAKTGEEFIDSILKCDTFEDFDVLCSAHNVHPKQIIDLLNKKA